MTQDGEKSLLFQRLEHNTVDGILIGFNLQFFQKTTSFISSWVDCQKLTVKPDMPHIISHNLSFSTLENIKKGFFLYPLKKRDGNWISEKGTSIHCFRVYSVSHFTIALRIIAKALH